MGSWQTVRRWLIEPFSSVVDPEERRAATLYASFVLVIASLGLTLGLGVFPAVQGAEDLWSNATWRAAALATVAFTVAYVLARLGRLRSAAYLVVGAAVVCSYLASLEEPRILLFMNTGVVIATVVVPFRASLAFAILTAAGPALLSAQVPAIRYLDLVYIQGVNVMLPALLLLVSWYEQGRSRERRQRDARLAELVRGSPDGILRLDRDGRIVSCNPAMETLSGYAASTLRGMSVADLGLPAGSDASGRADGPRIESAELRRSDGSLRTVECVLQAVDDLVFGRGLQLMVRDVEERQRARLEQERLEAQLQEARRLEALGRLAGGIAHDFNNQLTVILGSTALLRDLEPSEDLTAIRSAADHSRRLVAQLLAFSRGQPRDEVHLDVNEVLQELRSILRTLVRDDVRLELVTGTAPVTVVADRTQLEQVVINLVGNASDAMPEGGTLRVVTSVEVVDGEHRYASRLAPGRFAVIEVADEGVGIDPDHLDRVFEPFFTTKPEGVGTGLGLATVYGIAQQSGGGVFAESEPGTGTRFRVFLPWTELVPTAREVYAVPSGPALKGVGVLIVDDQPMVGELIAKILRQHGCVPTYVSDPVDAVRVFAGRPTDFELLVTDVIMPGLSGPQLARELRGMRPDLKVLLTSGYPGQEDVRAGRFLSKPFTADQLLQRVRRALSD